MVRNTQNICSHKLWELFVSKTLLIKLRHHVNIEIKRSCGRSADMAIFTNKWSEYVNVGQIGWGAYHSLYIIGCCKCIQCTHCVFGKCKVCVCRHPSTPLLYLILPLNPGSLSHSECSSPSLITPPQSPLNLETSSFASSQSQGSISTLPRISVSPVPIGERRKDR